MPAETSAKEQTLQERPTVPSKWKALRKHVMAWKRQLKQRNVRHREVPETIHFMSPRKAASHMQSVSEIQISYNVRISV